ncbi:MAG: type II toxin-antitoxin system RelE/ParE family toxin [Mangrovibacterium sp.]
MNEVVVLDSFRRDAKRLQKRYQSLKTELERFIKQTEEYGAQGTSLGSGLYKARIAIKSKAKGKRGGLRIISYQEIVLAATDSIVYLVAIYDKSETSTIQIREINKILRNFGL